MTILPDRTRLDDMRQLLWRLLRSNIFRKYVLLIGSVIGLVLIASSLVDIWFTARDHREALLRLQTEQATAAATRITQFIREIEAQLGWMTHLSWSGTSLEQRELDTLRLLRQVPAISEVILLDDGGKERLRVSRQAMDRVESLADLSSDPRFTKALLEKAYYGPVEFKRGTEPVMTLSLSGQRRDAGVVIAEINLTHIWDVIHTIRVGRGGRAYVVGPEGRLLAHPDISLVLRNTDMSHLAPVRSARSAIRNGQTQMALATTNIQGERVLTAYALAGPLDWMVFAELPEAEANEPLYESIWRSVLLTVAGVAIALIAALFLARSMVVPIQALSSGAARIGGGALDHRLCIETGDELQILGEQFNDMTARLQVSYLTLEREVDERTRELQEANLSKSRFLASASHDLRQPLHALNLLVAHVRSERDPQERARIAARIDTAVANMNELFSSLLDISKLEAGVLEPHQSSFPIADLLTRLDATFGPIARDKGLHFAVIPSSRWVRSDPILLDRILQNLVSNAVRYTLDGGIVIGCRMRGNEVRLDVCDSGIGIPSDQQRSIFAEFYRGVTPSPHGEGLGLGLAIVERLTSLLQHKIQVASTPGKGSRFSVLLPLTQPDWTAIRSRSPLNLSEDPSGRPIVIIDDDPLVLESTKGLLTSWGFDVIAAANAHDAVAMARGNRPDVIISDYRLRDTTGIEAIATVRNHFDAAIPAFLISGDVAPSLYAEAENSGLKLLHKPIGPMALRAMIASVTRTK